MNVNQRAARFSLIAFAGISLLTGLWSGLARMGWPLPHPYDNFVLLHGPLMIAGFLGTLIGLERAVAVKGIWFYGIPVLSSLSLIAAIGFTSIAAMLASAASLLLALLFFVLYRQYPSEHFIVMALSAFCWLGGNFIWFSEQHLFLVVPWWAGFLVLMIAGERLELSRIRRPPPGVRLTFHMFVLMILSGLLHPMLPFESGIRIAGLGTAGLAAWLLRYDLVWHNLREGPLPRFMARCLIAGYFWLMLAGVLWVFFAPSFSSGFSYDAMLHAIFLGFVFSMIFAHAPIILPTITGLALPFQRSFYIHAILLHVSLVMRVNGDLVEVEWLQQWGGLLNALAIALFLVNNLRAVKRGAQNA
jgi:hypothetical protein